MRLVAASLQPFDLGGFIATPGIATALRRCSTSSPPSAATTRSFSAIQTTARAAQAAEDIVLVSPDRARRPHSHRRDQGRGWVNLNISWDEERDNGMLE